MCGRKGDAFLGQVCNCTEVQNNDGNDLEDMSNKLNRTAIICVGVFIISGDVKRHSLFSPIKGGQNTMFTQNHKTRDLSLGRKNIISVHVLTRVFGWS